MALDSQYSSQKHSDVALGLLFEAGDLARLSGTTRQNIAYHARTGSLRPTYRTPAGRRLYSLTEATRWLAARSREGR